MVKIVVDSKRCLIDGKLHQQTTELIDSATSAYVTNYQFSDLYKRRKSDGSRLWDGKVHLYSRASQGFPPGVLDIVLECLKRHGVKYEIEKQCNFDYSLLRTNIPKGIGKFTFYDYQIKAMDSFLSLVKDPNNIFPRGIIKIPTSGGKTLIGATLAKIIDVPTLFIVRGKKLTKQNFEVIHEVFGKEKDRVGLIDAKTWNPQFLTVASVNTLFSRLTASDYSEELRKFLKNIEFIICDEVHRSTSKTFSSVLKILDAPIRLGLSATPSRKEDDRDLLLRSLIGPVVYDIPVEELKNKGTISRSKLTCLVISKPKKDSLSWEDANKHLIIHNAYRTNVITELAKQRINEGKTVLLLVGNSIPLAENTYNKLISKVPKDKVRMVNGASNIDDIDEAFNALKKKEISCVITTVIADEGIDIPSINCLLTIGGGESYNRTVQRVGRALRLKSDGSEAEVIDVMDTTNPYLKKHSTTRLTYYMEESLFDSVSTIKAHEILGVESEEGSAKGNWSYEGGSS